MGQDIDGACGQLVVKNMQQQIQQQQPQQHSQCTSPLTDVEDLVNTNNTTNGAPKKRNDNNNHSATKKNVLHQQSVDYKSREIGGALMQVQYHALYLIFAVLALMCFHVVITH